MKTLTVSVQVKSDISKVWDYFTNPNHIVNWNFASDDWFCPKAENEFKVGGKFSYIMSAKDNSTKFDFYGYFTKIENKKYIEYVMGDMSEHNIEDLRKVSVEFINGKYFINVGEYSNAGGKHYLNTL